MERKPHWVVFDVGGVLLDIRPGLEAASKYLNTSEEKLLEVFNENHKIGDLGEVTPEEFWEMVSKKLGGGDKTNGKEILRIYLSKCIPLEYTVDLAQRLKNDGYKLAVCTNTWKGISKTFWPTVVKNGILVFSIFEKVIESCEVNAIKPEIPIYTIVQERLGTTGSDIFLIDDSLENIRTAISIGWQTFHFRLSDDDGRMSCKKLIRMFGM